MSTTWLPMDTAPKNKYILAVIDGIVVKTCWEPDPGVTYDKPGWLNMEDPDPTYECFRPYNEDDGEFTHWAPWPEPPEGL